MIQKDSVSALAGKKIFRMMAEDSKDPERIAESQGLLQVFDISLINKAVDEVLTQNPEQVQEYLNGKEKIYGFFFGQVMKKGLGRFHPKSLNESLELSLKSCRKK